MKIKGLYHLKEINMKMKLRAMMDELESQEQKRKEAIGDGREQLEEKILMQEEQLAETRALLNTTEIELKSCREELAMTHRSKHKLVQWKMGAKKRLAELESAGADADAATRHYERLQAEQEKTKAELAALAGIEQRAEQRTAVVELKTSKQLQRMRSTLRREQRLKLQAYSRLEEVISDVSLGQSSVRHEEADVWLGKYQVCPLANIFHAMFRNSHSRSSSGRQCCATSTALLLTPACVCAFAGLQTGTRKIPERQRALDELAARQRD
jgi:hypothetical protein